MNENNSIKVSLSIMFRSLGQMYQIVVQNTIVSWPSHFVYNNKTFVLSTVNFFSRFVMPTKPMKHVKRLTLVETGRITQMIKVWNWHNCLSAFVVIVWLDFCISFHRPAIYFPTTLLLHFSWSRGNTFPVTNTSSRRLLRKQWDRFFKWMQWPSKWQWR